MIKAPGREGGLARLGVERDNHRTGVRPAAATVDTEPSGSETPSARAKPSASPLQVLHNPHPHQARITSREILATYLRGGFLAM